VLDHKMDHLVCFMGGSLALGAYTDPLGLQSTRAQRDLKTARALTYTCYQMYARMKTGIAPEFVQFHAGNDFSIGRGAPHYLLRPETVESFFILNQLTGDPIYREWGWEVFQSIEKYCKTAIAYGALSNVQDTEQQPRDKMESFFLAETIKYLYLLQDPDTEIDVLNKHVFNTEAHPLRIFPLIDEEARAGQQLKQQA
jgi:Glycosyl hydrolase family 47